MNEHEGHLGRGEGRGHLPPNLLLPSPSVSQEMNIQQLTSYRKSVMSLAEAGKLYRKDLEIVLCSEPPL